MISRCIVMPLLLLAALEVGCSRQEQERIGAIPAQSEMRAEQIEAQQFLQQVYSMQQSYFAANRQYGGRFSDIGVELPLRARYRYALSSTGSTWRCEASANLDRDPTVDTWVVDQRGAISCTSDDATA